MNQLILTKNYKNIMNSYWSKSGSYEYFDKGITTEDGTTYPYASLLAANFSLDSICFAFFAALGSGAPGNVRKKTTPSSSDCNSRFYDIGYESGNLSEDSYQITRTTASVYCAGVDNSTIKKIFTITNAGDSAVVVNTIASFYVLSGDSSYQTCANSWKNVMMSAYKFDDITIPAHGSATILCDFE